MRTLTVRLLAAALALPVYSQLAPVAMAQTYGQFKVKLPMVQRSVLANVQGRLDHMAYDLNSGRLFVAASRNGSVEALDRNGMRVAQTIKDLPEPSGMAFIQEQSRLAVSCGDGSVRFFKADKEGELTPERSVQLRGEADPLRFDPIGGKLWVGHGHMVSWIDPKTGDTGGQIKLPDAPEGMVAEAGGKRLFVNVAKRGEIFVIDRDESKIIATWTLKDTKGNYPMAIDELGGRLFIAAREPSAFIALDLKDGREVARIEIPGEADDLWYDAPGKRIYASCGGAGGKVAMIQQDSADKYTLEHLEGTAAGARTSLLVPERRRYIVTAPALGDQPTFVYIYIIPP